MERGAFAQREGASLAEVMLDQTRELRSKLIELVRNDLRTGNLKSARRRYRRLIGVEPDNPAHLVKLGELEVKLGSPTEAVNAWFRAGGLFAADAFEGKAVALYKRALDLEPGRSDVLSALADAHLRLGQREDAMVALRRSRAALEQEGRLREALDVRRRLAQLDPANTAVRFELACELDEAGLALDAIFEYAEVVVEFARVGDPGPIPTVYERLVGMLPDETADFRALTAMLDQASSDSVRSAIAEKLGKDPEAEAVDDALERLLISRAWRETLENLYRRVAGFHREWIDGGSAP
jgi:tetratricopeptide (TPR) repeat protein